MNITDEKLSAFLDAELPDAEMEVIRDALVSDENIANRLADLAMVDEVVAASYRTIDARPVPDLITNLLAEPLVAKNPEISNKNFSEKKKFESAKIIVFPILKKFQNALQKNIAIAASVLMVLGLGAIQVLHENGDADNWKNIAKVLDTAPSGIAQVSKNGVEITPRLTFLNKAGEYCRQFDMNDNKSATENIACRKENKWQLTVSVVQDKVQQKDSYQTASGGSLLDDTVEQMTAGDFFDAHDEAAAIEQRWVSPKKHNE